MMSEKKYHQTPSQTVGPFFAYGLTPEQYRYNFSSIAFPEMALASTKGEQILLTGRVFDGEGHSVVDAMLEFRQADSEGNYPKKGGEGFMGFGRVGTGMNEEHHYEIRTIKPGAKEGAAPHIDVTVFMRGMLSHLYTRIYFSDEHSANEQDPLLQRVPEGRRSTLIAQRKELDGLIVYHFDIYMQGAQETVFFDV